MTEYWVIEDSRKNAVFPPNESEILKGYIPRAVGEKIIGRKTKNGESVFFTREQCAAMRAHPEWKAALSKPESGG